MKLLSSITIASLLLAQSGLAAKRCYYPSGKEASGDHPCDPDAEDSPCCAGAGLGHHCLSNGLCAGKTQIARGSCTDQSWNSPECTKVCLSPGVSNGGSDLASCQNVTGIDTDSYCCLPNSNSECCNKGTGRFNILPQSPVVWAIFNSASTRFAVVTPRSGAQSSAPATTTSSSSTATSISSGSASAPTSTATSSNSNGSDQSTTDKQQEDEGASSGLSGGAKAGIGVGAAVGALLLGAILYLVWKLKKSRDMHAPPPAGNQYVTSPGSQWGAPAYSDVNTPTQIQYTGQPQAPPYYGYDARIQQPVLKVAGELPTERAPQELPGSHQY